MNPQMTPIIPIAQVLISFAGYDFLAVQLPGGKIAVVFNHFCEALGVSRTSQLRRILANPTLAKNFVLVRIQTPGGPQDVNALVVSVLSLWLGGFDLPRLSAEKRRLIVMLQEDAEEAFTRPFVVTPIEPPQQPKAPPPPPAQDMSSLSLPELMHAVGTHMEQRFLKLESQVVQQIEQSHRELEAWMVSIDRQRMEDVALMAEKGRAIEVHAEQIHALTTWIEHFQTQAGRQSGQPGQASMPMPSPARLQVLKTMPYEDYLQTPEWKAQREAALKRALYRCQVCNGNKTPLHVHHRTYERRGCELPEDLFVLCEQCHGRYHAQFAAKPPKQAGNTPSPASDQETLFPDYEI